MKQGKFVPKRFASYRQFVERFPIGLAILHVPSPENTGTWKIIAANWLATHLVGSRAEAFLHGPLTANLPKSTNMPSLVRQVLRFGEVKALGHIYGREFAADPYGSRSPGDSVFWAKLFPVDNCCVGFTIEDQSLLRRARLARTESARESRLVSELARAILWRADLSTLEVKYVSPESEQILGFWPERWQNEKDFWKRHVHPEDFDGLQRYCHSVVHRPDQREDFEFRMISAQGTVLWFRLLVRRVVNHDRRAELLGVMTEVTKLKQAEQHTQDLSRRLIHLQDQEHRRISRELHDSVGQNLAALRMSLHVLEQKAELLDDKGRLALRDAVEAAESAIQETRTVSYLLHPPTLDELGLLKALDWFVDGFSKRSGISVRLQAPPRSFRLPADMELALFRVVQECLTNVHRHSHGSTAEVRIKADGGTLLLEVSDSGTGIPPEVQTQLLRGSGKSGVGLSGIRERVAEMNGHVDIDSNRHGTTIRVLVPAQSLDADFQEVPNGVLPFARGSARGKAS